MTELELRNVLDYEEHKGYEIFKSMHERFKYSDIDPAYETVRAPIIKSFEEFKENLKQTNICFVVLKEDEEKVVGYIIFDVSKEGYAKIQEIVVKPENRRSGFGRKAIKQLIEILREDEEIAKVKVLSATISSDCFFSSCNFRYISEDTYEYKLRK